MRTLSLIILFLALALLFSCALFPASPVYYHCPPTSAIVVDAYTGKPIEGVTVNVRWAASHHRGLFVEGSDSMNIFGATTMTDKNGVFTIPAWKNKLARKWHLHDWEPNAFFTKSGYKPKSVNNNDSQESVTATAFPYIPVTLKPPSWAADKIELERLDQNFNSSFTTNITSDVAEETLSNSLAYYVVYGDMVENGRYVNSTDFLNTGYIRPKPNLVITNIKSFSVNLPKNVLYHPGSPDINWHVYGLDKQPSSAFSITLFEKDAQNVARLEQAYQTEHNFLFMLNNKPLAETYLSRVYDPDIRPHMGPQTIYLPLREHQDIHEIEQVLQKLVQQK